MDEHDRRTGYGPAATKTSRFFAFSRLRARQEIRCTFCCWPPGPLARRERRAYPVCPVRYVRSEQHRQRACGPQPGGARRRAGICFVVAPRRWTPASPASRRLASARPALAPKCTPYFLTGLKPKIFRNLARIFCQMTNEKWTSEVRTTNSDFSFVIGHFFLCAPGI